jgi:hypothetical protein
MRFTPIRSEKAQGNRRGADPQSLQGDLREPVGTPEGSASGHAGVKGGEPFGLRGGSPRRARREALAGVDPTSGTPFQASRRNATPL